MSKQNTTAARDSVRISESPVARDGRQMHPNSIAALQAHQWQPGQSGNPRGRTTFGATYREWVAEFAAEDDDGSPRYPLGKLREIAQADDDAAVSAPKRLAAVDMLEALEAGTDRHRAADRLFDRSEGKPGQSIAISADAAPAVQFNAPSPAIEPTDTPKLPDAEEGGGE